MFARAMILHLAVGILAVVIFMSSCSDCREIPGIVRGHLWKANGQGMGQITVQLVDVETGTMLYSETSDDDGNFMFNTVEAGKYTIKTIPIGGGEYENDCGEFTLSPGKTLTLQITITLPN